ncbi:MAG TPA: hypothetical protein VGT24_02465 [Candidatus Acidoferrales bacterium]|nr:hypothetical protein [Candidatus Acidoferrales bacterium]
MGNMVVTPLGVGCDAATPARSCQAVRRVNLSLTPLDLAIAFWRRVSALPLLLVDEIGVGLAVAVTAALLYVPFSQRSLLLMKDRSAETKTHP